MIKKNVRYALFLAISSDCLASDAKPKITGTEKIKQMIYSVFKKKHDQNRDQYANINKDSLSKDLQINELVDYFNCQTLMGKIFLLNALTHPLNSDTTDYDKTIKKRAAAIRLLITNPTIKESVEKLLKITQENEPNLEHTLNSFSDGKFTKTSYIEKKIPQNINKGSSWIEWINSIVLDAFFIKKIVVALLSNDRHKSFLSKDYSTATNNGEFIGALLSISYADPSQYLLLRVIERLPGIVKNTYKLYSDTEVIKSLNSLHVMIASAEKMQKLHYYFNMNKKQPLNKKEAAVIHYLKTYPLKRYFYPFSHNFLRYNFYGNENALTDTLYTIGELDTYNALATKFLELEHSQTPFCFTSFLSEKDPLIDIESGWNVLVKNCVPNDLTESKNIILTGPNAGGKSSFGRMILQNILLSQTFGIAAAKKCALTPFHVIHSNVNITDNQTTGESLFQAELNAAKAASNTIESLPTGQKYFLFFDELFKGTDNKNGEECAKGYLEALATTKKKLLLIFGSHFESIKKVATANPKKFVNYKVETPVIDNDGNLKYSFKLTKGTYTGDIGLKLAERMNIFKPFDN